VAGKIEATYYSATNGKILGYAQFEVFPDSLTQKFHVTFDSVSVLTAKAPCQYVLPAAVTSTITPPSGCGVETLTRFMLDGTVPQLSIIPNPTSGDISISSTRDLGNASIVIYNMLGVKQSNLNLPIGKNTPAKITMPLANGVYNLRVNYGSRAVDLRVVVNH
jgi:hypothetical protein